MATEYGLTFTGPGAVSTTLALDAETLTKWIDADGTLYQKGVILPTNAELAYLSGVTAGTVTANKAVVVGANKNIDTIAIATSGLKIGAGAGTAVTTTAAELNVNAGVVAGTVSPSKTVVVDANKHIDVLGLPVSGLKIGTSGSETVVTATGAALNFLTNSVAGTNVVSSALVTDSQGRIDKLIANSTLQFQIQTTQGGETIFNKSNFGVTASGATFQAATLSSPNVTGGCGIRATICVTNDAGDATTTSIYYVSLQRAAGAGGTAGTVQALTTATVGGANAPTITFAIGAASGSTSGTQTHAVNITATKGGGGSTNEIITCELVLINNTPNGWSIA